MGMRTTGAGTLTILSACAPLLYAGSANLHRVSLLLEILVGSPNMVLSWPADVTVGPSLTALIRRAKVVPRSSVTHTRSCLPRTSRFFHTLAHSIGFTRAQSIPLVRHLWEREG